MIINKYYFGFLIFLVFVAINLLIFKKNINNPFVFSIFSYLILTLLIIIKNFNDIEILICSISIFTLLSILFVLFILGLNNSVSVFLMMVLLREKKIDKSYFFKSYIYQQSFLNRVKLLVQNKLIFNKDDKLYINKNAIKIIKMYNLLVKIFLHTKNTG